MKTALKKIALLTLTPLLAFSFIGLSGGTASAIAGSDFKSGRIIDDSVFFTTGTISAADIQAFFNAKMPVCDTNGTQMYNATQTRAQYGASKGYSAPYVCLKDYSQDTYARAADNYCTSPITGGVKTAAQIVADVSQACNINAKVLIVLLQKEQALVSDDWPWSIEYRSATGFGCPDTAPCDATYYGFYNQVYNAARQFERYSKQATLFSYQAGKSNFVQFNPNASCSGSNVPIETQATAALYNYTPYQPNQAALNNLLGSGDGCSAYGNRNFWRLYYEWFGTPYNLVLPGCSIATNTSYACVWRLRNTTNKVVFTTDDAQRDALAQAGNIFEGTAFYGNDSWAIQPGNIPIYSLTAPNGETFLTTSSAEKNSLAASGYKDNGISFYADPPNANAGYPVFRVFSSAAGSHVWTGDYAEYTRLLASGYTSEGIVFNSLSPVRQETPAAPGKDLVYRFYIPQTLSHFWTTDIYERDRMLRTGYDYEGVAWLSSSTNTTTPVYRLYAPSLNQHLYTIDKSEHDYLVASGGWNDEGVSQYVSNVPAGAPIYRLYAPATGVHLQTSDLNERNVLASSGSWRSEGIAWYQP
jgi:hypothetical protein